jgi:hypothetical protein
MIPTLINILFFAESASTTPPTVRCSVPFPQNYFTTKITKIIADGQHLSFLFVLTRSGRMEINMIEIIKSIDVDRWSEPNEKRQVRHLGMIKAKEAFDMLTTHLQSKNMLPDEYFLFSPENFERNNGELPDYMTAICHTNFGDSEGIYIDIVLEREGVRTHFATGKTLEEDADAFFQMSRIAAECSLMLNGRGAVFEKMNIDTVFTPEESLAIGAVIEQKLCEYNEPEEEKMLGLLFEKVYPFDDRYGTPGNENTEENELEV